MISSLVLAKEALTSVWLGGGGKAGKGELTEGAKATTVCDPGRLPRGCDSETGLEGKRRCDGKRQSLGSWMLSPLLNLVSRARDCLSPPGVE